MNSKTALITGASSGIGYELAKLFAKDNYSLVIVSRDETKLQEVARELEKIGSPKVAVIAKDLSRDGSAQELYNEVRSRGIEVNILVNDAGFGEHGLFVETDLEKELKIIHLNIISLTVLTKLFLKEMVKRNEGRVLQLSSIAGFMPNPLLAVYSATKAYVQSFTDSLINELKDSKVTVTALVPGATDTDFFNKADAENTVAANGSLSSPAEVALEGYKAMLAGEHRVIVGLKNKAMVAASNILPDEMVTAAGRAQMEEKN